jgi:hypothetical protein
MRRPPPELREFLEPYDAAVGRVFLATRAAVLAAAPRAVELVYDAYNAVSCAYSFTDRLKDAFCHVAAYPAYVNLGFNRGAQLADPDGLLVGTGASIRHARISGLADLRRPAVGRLVRGAAVQQGRALAPAAPAEGRSIVKAVHPRKRRPR